MNSRKRSIRLWLGLMAATGAGLCLAPDPAATQILDRNPPFQAPPSRPLPPPADAADPWLTPDDQTSTDTGWAADARPASAQTAPAENLDGVDPREAAEQAAEAHEVEEANAPVVGADDGSDTDEFGEARTRPRRLPPQDGDIPTVIEEAVQPSEGIVDLNAPAALLNEEDMTLADMRNARDLAIYAGIAPGFDPLLLEAQETNPVFSTIPGLSVDPDPFVPLGRRLGSFILFTSLQTDGDYNSNVFASPEALGDYALELWPAARLASNWSRHAVEVRVSGDLSYHDKYQTEDDRAYLVEALSRIDITRFSDIQAYVAHQLAQESRSAINATSFGTRPDVVVNRASLAANQRFNRLSVQLRGNVIDTAYGNDVVAGVVESNSDRDFTLYEEAVRPRWEFNPDLFAFSDISFNQRDYPTAAFTDDLNRTSNGERYRFGVSFGNTSQILNGTVSLGYGSQDYGNPLLQDIHALLFDADLTWHITPLTALLFTATTEVAETTTTDTGGVLERQYALALRHSFSTRLIGTTGISYYNRDFVGGNLTEQQTTGAAGLEYYLSREWVLFGRYQHSAFYTTSQNGNYTAEEVQMGVRLRH